jgi:viologen exporter family transport system permease protein
VRALLVFWRALLATNLRAAYALRGAFWTQVLLMVVNDLVWFSVWWVYFARFETMAGWRLNDLMTLYGVIVAGFGTAVVLGGGVRVLAETISEGALDSFLAQPKPALLHVISSKTVASGWGDIATAVLFLALSGHATVPDALRAALAVVASAVSILSAGVLFHALAFWLGPVQAFSRQLWEFLITFSHYPDTLFGGGMRFLLFTLIPAGVVAWVPADFVRAFSWERLATLLAASAGLALAAGLTWRAGLRRYASGSRIGAGP